MKNLFLSLVGSILLAPTFSQTVLNRIPIQSPDPYIIYVWDFYTGQDPRWMSQHEIRESGETLPAYWEYLNELTVRVEPMERLDILFISGGSECKDSTHVIIYGARRQKVKIKTDTIILDGGQYTFGPEPLIPNPIAQKP